METVRAAWLTVDLGSPKPQVLSGSSTAVPVTHLFALPRHSQEVVQTDVAPLEKLPGSRGRAVKRRTENICVISRKTVVAFTGVLVTDWKPGTF